MDHRFDPEFLERLRVASRIAVLTGAGVSAESGVPTFRDALTGLWAKFDPAQLATPEAFARDPELVSQWYDDRRCNVAACKPNAGHHALAELEQRVMRRSGEFTLITQNVDRLHQSAGSRNVVELHGTLWIWRCIRCGEEAEIRGERFPHYPPHCSCGGLRRPGVVWFGESLPPDALQAAHSAAANCELFLSIGTSSIVYPAAGLIDVALGSGAGTLEINPEPTPYTSRMDWSIRDTSAAALPALIQAAFGSRGGSGNQS
jgi:NAD-dependent deacetylase